MNKQAEIEMQEIFDWANEQENIRVNELKAQGKWLGGYDTNNNAFDDIREERDKRLYALADKYGIAYK